MTLTAQAPCRAGDRRPKLLTKRTRREGLRLTVTAVAWPWAAGRIGFLSVSPRATVSRVYAGFVQGMHELGYVEGEDFVTG